MTDVTFTTTLVKPFDNNYQHRTLAAGETIAPCDSCYEDTNVSPSVWRKADANASITTAAAKGIALNGGAVGQPVRVFLLGDLTCDGLTAGVVYVVSANAGKVAPAADITTGWFVTVLGVALTATKLRVAPIVSGIASA